MSVSLQQARRVKDRASALARAKASVAGVGLTRIGLSYAIKVNLAENASLSELPQSLDGVQIVYEIVGRPRALADG